jgi:L-alanine-DL-glutamate epimerase-like enolase superfamily enzyme
MRLLRAAHAAGLETMVGCMLGTSLAMAPAMLLAPACRFVDLDAPLLIGGDRTPALVYRDGRIEPATPDLWG